MLTLDPALFPKLTTRRALVVVDAQNDFLDPDVGALPVLEPSDLTARLARLAKAFRPYGDIVWIRSEYRESRATEDESVVTSDAPVVAAGRRAVARGRRAQVNPHDLPTATCPEAFLTAGGGPERPACVRRGTPGAAFPALLGDAVQPRDLQSVKSHYSAFRSDELLPRLRMKLVQELFICGSLTNMGVQATAMDAASHGLDITIVEDCCGYRSLNRHKNALRQIIKTTSCETVTSDAIVDRLAPKKPANGEDTVPQRPEADRTLSSSSRDPIPTPAPAEVLSSFANMSIDDAPRDGGVRSKVESKEAISTAVVVEADSESCVPSQASPASTDSARAESAADESPPATDEKKPESEPLRPADDKDTSAAPQAKSLEDALDLLTINGDTASAGNESKVVVQTKKLEASSLPTKSASPKVTKNPKDEPPTNVAEEPCDMDPKSAKPSESEPLCEGDTRIHYDVLPDELLEGIFERLRDEVQWLCMSHQGGEVPRLVAVQGEVDEEGNIPIYRHPADESPPLLPWTKTVREIKEVAERKVGHELNHALIQFYRDGTDYISEHSDKTLDIAHDSYIVNVSLGAERTMIFRTKRQPKPVNGSGDTVASEAKPAAATGGNSNGAGAKREQQRARLPHNSLCQMGLRTNKRWLHAIKQDKRPGREKTTAELAFGGARISLTFRRIDTFLDAGGRRIWGQGATGKTRAAAGAVADGGTTTTTSAAVAMLRAFGRENQDSVFDWAHHYGAGFDVVHLPASPRLFTSADPVANARVQLMLAERGVGYARGTLAPAMAVGPSSSSSTTVDVTAAAAAAAPPIKFVDNDPARSTVHGDLAILLYLDHAYPATTDTTASDRARQYTRLQQALALPSALALAAASTAATATPAEDDAAVTAAPPPPSPSPSALAIWETYAASAAYLSGDDAVPGLPDFVVWPVLRAVREREGGGLTAYPALEAYYSRMVAREAGQRVLGLGAAASSSSAAAGAGAAVAPPRGEEGPGAEKRNGTGKVGNEVEGGL